MKKILLASTLFLFVGQAFATDYKLIANSNSSENDLCSKTLSITKQKDSMTISGHSELGAYFNLDSAEGDLVIKSINKGSLKESSRNSSHGTLSSTTTKATLENNILELRTVTKFGRFIPSKADNILTADFSEDMLILEIERSYDEAFSSSSDWQTYQKCEYKKL